MKQRGFSLVEMAVVILIMGILASGGLQIASSSIENARYSATREKQKAIKDALISYIGRNFRLPCPAVETVAKGAAGYGVAANSTAFANTTCNTTTGIGGTVARRGMLPFSDLGIPEDMAYDAFGNKFAYIVTSSATTTAPTLTKQTIGTIAGNITLHTTTPTGVANQINPAPNQAVVLIISYGKNGAGAFTTTGARIAVPVTALEVENTNVNIAFVDTSYTTLAANPFDDVLIYWKPDDLLRPLAADGTIPSSSQATAFALQMQPYVDALTAKSRITSTYALPANGAAYTTDTTLTLPNDGWGRQVTYTRQVAAPFIVCSSPYTGNAYTFASAGPDGLQGNADDIILTKTKLEVRSAVMVLGGTC